MKGQELRAAARRRMARTGESYLEARGSVTRRWWHAFTKRRPGTVYEVRTIHEKRGTNVRGYVGKTRQLVVNRAGQHGQTQPWADLIVGVKTLKAGSFTDLGLWWAEVWRIVLLWPVYNYEWNRLNPRRVPKYVAAERHRSHRCRHALRLRERRLAEASVERARQRRGQAYRWPTNSQPPAADPFAETRW